jgi:hypothetical protein
MINSLKGYAEFLAIQRGLMLFMVTLGGAFLIGGSTSLHPALLLGAIVFCFWSFSDAINNIYDKELDAISDPKRAEFTEKLGKKAYFITCLFAGLVFSLGALTLNWSVFFVISVGMLLGFVYSAPPIRLRTTIVKPLVNFVFGGVAIFISAAYFWVFTLNVLVLTLFFGIVTTVNSIWGDLAELKTQKFLDGQGSRFLDKITKNAGFSGSYPANLLRDIFRAIFRGIAYQTDFHLAEVSFAWKLGAIGLLHRWQREGSAAAKRGQMGQRTLRMHNQRQRSCRRVLVS